MRHLAKARWLAGMLLAGVLAACSGIDTHIDSSPGFRQGDYRNYAWSSPPLVDSRDSQLLEVDRTVRASVDAELQKRGFVEVAKNAAAGLVDYRLASKMDVSQGSGSNSPRDDAARALDLNRSSATNVAVYNHPTLPYLQRVELLLSIQAQRSGDVVWQGTASKAVDNVNAGEQFSKADIQQAVGLLLQQLKDSDK
jgi:hypothetical protein